MTYQATCPLGCALAMRVMQSDLYRQLDDSERADCDELVRQNLEWFKADAALPPQAKAAEYGWLIENGKRQGDGLAYRYVDNDGGGVPAWTEDHSKALRFARRADAEQYAHHDEDAWRIVEHAWDSAVDEVPQAKAEPAGVSDEGDGSGPLREGWSIMIGPGHSGFGAYAVMDEGSVCLAVFDPADYPDARAILSAAPSTGVREGAAGVAVVGGGQP